MSHITTADLAAMLAGNPDIHLDDPDALKALRSRRAPAQSERALQMAVIAEAERRALTDARWGLLFHVPSGEYRRKATAGRLKAMGVKAGVPDMALPIACKGFISAWLELKVGRNVLSVKQKEWHRALREHGHFVCTVYDDSAKVISIIDWYLEGAGE